MFVLTNNNGHSDIKWGAGQWINLPLIDKPTIRLR